MIAWPRRNFILAGIGIAVMGAAALAGWLSQSSALAAVHQGIVTAHPSVKHIDAAQYAQYVQDDSASLMVFDTREAEEFAVSHLAGAIRIPPNLPPNEFIRDYGDLVEGMTVVFYCSVGARSSKYAEQSQDRLRALGADDVVNLEGGLFGWHNEERPLVDASGKATPAIHPYDQYWGRLIDRSALMSPLPDE